MSTDYRDYEDGVWTPEPGILAENQLIINPPRGVHPNHIIPSIEHGTNRDDPDYDRAGTPGLREVYIMNIGSGGPIPRRGRDQ